MHSSQQNHSGMSWASARRDAGRRMGVLPGFLAAIAATTAILAALRLAGVIGIGWRAVLLPLWIWPAAAVAAGSVAVAGLAVAFAASWAWEGIAVGWSRLRRRGAS